jgi:predicted alpha/beta-hydrolase family hydrolase
MGIDQNIIIDGESRDGWVLLLAHGAGQGMDSPFMAGIAEAIAGVGIAVVRFNFPYMVKAMASGRKRPPDREQLLRDSFQQAIAEQVAAGIERRRLVIGGKSMGGRIASLIADGQQIAGLVCLGYPFHPPGRPERLRTAHLQGIRTPTLICQGERDPFGRREEVEAYPLSSAINIHWVNDGEHSFKPRKASAVTQEDNLRAAATAMADFIAGL